MDSDSLTNLEEFVHGTDPTLADTVDTVQANAGTGTFIDTDPPAERAFYRLEAE